MTTHTANSRWLQFSADDEYEPAPDISPSGMAIAAVPVLCVFILSAALRLGNVQTLIIATIRCVAQLMILGLILYPIFVNNQPYVVIPYIFVMVLFAIREASVKPKHRYKGMRLHMLLSLMVGLTTSFAFISGLVLKPFPFWDASVMIPVCGMLMGSSVNALSLGMDRLLLSLSDSGGRGSARLQTYLACGASRWEASLPSIREAIETGLTPNLNQMSIMGLVSIPGMMAGQILGGTSPLVAAKYQIIIMFFICSNSTLVLFGTIFQAVFYNLFDKQHRFRSELVSKRKGGKPKDIVLAIVSYTGEKMGLYKDDSDKADVGKTERTFSLNDTKSSTIGMKRGMFETFSSTNTSTNELLRLRNGEIEFADTLHLSELCLVIKEGDLILLQGPSGCGKSTLLRGLALFESFGDSATLEVKGKSANGLGGAEYWRAEVCYVRQQGGQGLRGTPQELLRDLSALHSQKKRLEDTADTSKRLDRLVRNVQKNIEKLELPVEMMSRRWDELSGGESQRVYLCVLLALCPQILLVDEPTSALDDRNSLLVEKLLLESNISLVWVTHNKDQMERLQEEERTTVVRYRDLSVNDDRVEDNFDPS